MVCVVFYIEAVVEILLTQSGWGRTFLHRAVEDRSADTVRRVLAEIPVDVGLQILSVRDKDSQTVLHYAARNSRHEDKIQTILEYLIQNYYPSNRGEYNTLYGCYMTLCIIYLL